MRIYNSFESLPCRRGYGVVFLQNKEQYISKMNQINWGEISFPSTNSALNLRTSLILEQITD